MKSSKWILMLVGMATVLLLAGCGGGSNGGNTGNGGTVAAADAETIYKKNCITCHAADLSGQNLATVGARLSHDEIAEKIRKGGGGMMAFEGRLNAAEITALTDWLAEKK